MPISRNACALPDFPEFAQTVRYGIPGTPEPVKYGVPGTDESIPEGRYGLDMMLAPAIETIPTVLHEMSSSSVADQTVKSAHEV
jgi:hypothetical protein